MKTKGNILLVANWQSDVGYAWWLMENFWLTIADHFTERGYDCFLFYPKITVIPEKIQQSQIIIKELDMQNRAASNLIMLRRFIMQNNIKNVYFSDYPSRSLLYLALKIFGINKIVIHDHSPGDRTRPGTLKKLYKSLINGIPYYTADHFIAVTNFVHDRHLHINCIPSHKCSIAPNGITPINLDTADHKFPFHEFNIPEDRLIVVTTGRATYYKGIDFFIKCADHIINKKGNKKLHFLYCGDGPDLEDFKKLAADLDLNEHFTFAGKRNDISQILPGCSIGFHTATGEVGYSLSILEYMSAGLVAVVPDSPSTSMAISNMHNGILYTPRNIESATSSLLEATDTNAMKTIQQHAVSDIKDKYTIEKTNTKLIKILNTVFNNNQHSSSIQINETQ